MGPVRVTILAIAVLGLLQGCSLGGSGWNTHAYRVRPGDTLYAIAWRYQIDYQRLAEWNDIDAPYTIYPGQELLLIDPARLSAERRPARASAGQPRSENKSRPTASEKRVAASPPELFQWPVQGKVVRRFDGSKRGSQGIDIAGSVGQAVNASADGRVVYSGSGLVGYGKLVIVKHNDDYLSAYAHNSTLRVKEGDRVKAGQVIAEMGLAESDAARLHFEIRKQGKPVDPLKYLPEQ